MLTLHQMLQNKKFLEVDMARKKPMPFAGKYPTRWVIRLPLKTGIWTYIGKPVYRVYRFIVRNAPIAQASHGLFYEFDRGGAIAYAGPKFPRYGVPVDKWNDEIMYRYYPWHGHGGDFFFAYRNRVPFNKELEYKGHTFFVYSPWDKMSDYDHRLYLKEYVAWLEKSQPWKK